MAKFIRKSGVSARIYGDSIMKGIILDGSKYRATINSFLDALWETFGIKAVNRAKFGCTVDKGHECLKRDLAKGITEQFALLEYGGNDCDFDWKEVAAAPDTEHLPKTELPVFTETLGEMADELTAAGVKPMLMTLPPIDAARYLNHIAPNSEDRSNILHWLGGDVQMIYRYHESYSNAIVRLADRKNLELVDVRSYFLDKHNYSQLISMDGIHPSTEGYRIIYSAFEDSIKNLI